MPTAVRRRRSTALRPMDRLSTRSALAMPFGWRRAAAMSSESWVMWTKEIGRAARVPAGGPTAVSESVSCVVTAVSVVGRKAAPAPGGPGPGGAAESGDLPGMPGSMNLLMHMQCRSEK